MKKLIAILTGRLKWYLLGLWVVSAVIPKAYWNWFYVESIYYKSTIILPGIIVVLLLISLFYEAYQEQKAIEAK